MRRRRRSIKPSTSSKKIFGFITQYLVEEISYYLDNFSHDSDEIVIAALKIAKDRNKVNGVMLKVF